MNKNIPLLNSSPALSYYGTLHCCGFGRLRRRNFQLANARLLGYFGDEFCCVLVIGHLEVSIPKRQPIWRFDTRVVFTASQSSGFRTLQQISSDVLWSTGSRALLASRLVPICCLIRKLAIVA